MYPPLMTAASKIAMMTSRAVDAYNAALRGAAGRTAILGMHGLTRGCGQECSVDGVHSAPSVYDASMGVLLNMHRHARADATSTAP